MMLYEQLIDKTEKLSVVGLGYVGIPIAVAFANKINVIGFDLNKENPDLSPVEGASQILGRNLTKESKIRYSPERINPGDKVHRLNTITKIVSGMDEETLDCVAQGL